LVTTGAARLRLATPLSVATRPSTAHCRLPTASSPLPTAP